MMPVVRGKGRLTAVGSEGEPGGRGYLLQRRRGRVGDHGLPASPGPLPLADVGQDRLVQLRAELQRQHRWARAPAWSRGRGAAMGGEQAHRPVRRASGCIPVVPTETQPKHHEPEDALSTCDTCKRHLGTRSAQ